MISIILYVYITRDLWEMCVNILEEGLFVLWLHTVKPSLSGTNGPPVCFFHLVSTCFSLRLSGRMSALRTRPSPRTLDVISSTWSLHYLLSSTMLPSRRTATWNAWLASSLKPSWNCVLKRRRLFLLSSASSHVCRSQKKIPPLLLSQRENKQGHPLAVCLRSLVQILFHFCKLQSPVLQHNYSSLILQREKKNLWH